MKKISALIACLCMTASVFAQDITGSWSGILDVGPAKFPLVFNIVQKEGTYSATMDSPNQGAKGIPVSTVTFKDARLNLAIANLMLSYEGTLRNDSIIGTFKQNGMSFPLSLTRGKVEVKQIVRPQDPQPPYPYYSEEVRFENQQAGITLAGTFTRPQEGKNFPVAVLVSGSGPQNRNEELLDHRPFLVLSDYLTRNGIAVLRYDDRGVGESTGNYQTANLDDFTSDAASAVGYLKTRKDIHPKKIGIIGHSEGGTIAFTLAGEKSNGLAFIVSMAGMSIPGDSLMQMQRALMGKASGVSDAMIAQNEAVIVQINDLIRKHPADYIRQNMDSLIDELLPDLLKGNQAARNGYQQGIVQMLSPEMQSLLSCNPAESLKRIQCPVLALGGEKDLQVPADINLERVKALVKGPVTTKKYLGLNHLFQHCTTGLPTEYKEIEETLSPEVMADMAVWIKGIRK